VAIAQDIVGEHRGGLSRGLPNRFRTLDNAAPVDSIVPRVSHAKPHFREVTVSSEETTSAAAATTAAMVGPITLAVVAPVPSTTPGMGAIPYDGGTSFRVWAPFAVSVWLAGTFNEWADDTTPLASEGNGYWSVDVDGAGPGDRYKYVIRDRSRGLWRIDPYARDVTHSAGETIVTLPRFEWPDDGFQTPPWNELVIYELHVGTFNMRPGGRPGSFRSVIRKLDHLKELGVNAIELMPSKEFATDFSWGYNPAHLFAIESAYGGPRGLKRLVRSAHARGIAVFFDTVYNHFGPSDLDLWQFDGWSENEKGGIYFYNDHRSWTEWGDTRPDYGRAEVRQFIRDNALYWLEDFRLDGLRWDATAKIRNVYGGTDPAHDLADGWNLMRWINDEIDSRQPWKLQIAEDLRNDEGITRPTAEGGAGFDTQWDSEFVHPVRAALIAPNDEARDMAAVARAIEHRYGGDAFRRVVYTESHDEVANGRTRVPTEIWPDNPTSWASRKRSTLGAALVLTSPGIPMLFQGQEFLEERWFHDEHALDWNRAEEFVGILSLHRDLIRLRRNWFDHTRGLRGQHVNVFHVNDVDKVIAFHRWDRGGPRDDVVVVANFANRAYDGYEVGFPRGGRWRVRHNSDWWGYGEDFGNQVSHDPLAVEQGRHGLPFRADVGLGPYTAVILSQDG
jgi:1,4-alpha-glucan branching enzyme